MSLKEVHRDLIKKSGSSVAASSTFAKSPTTNTVGTASINSKSHRNLFSMEDTNQNQAKQNKSGSKVKRHERTSTLADSESKTLINDPESFT